jgi:hypothetical protein
MKLSKLAAGLALGASLLLASSAFASNKGDLQLFQKVTLDGKALSPGQYKVEWNGSGNDVHLKVLKDGDVVATAMATMKSGNSQDNDGYVTTKEKNGSEALTSIFFGGKDWSLQLHPAKSGATTM